MVPWLAGWESKEPFYPAWSPDGKTVYSLATSPHGSSIRAVAVTGGPSRLLIRFDDPTRQHTRYGFTTDGRTFYFTIGAHESDIWAAQLHTLVQDTLHGHTLADLPFFERHAVIALLDRLPTMDQGTRVAYNQVLMLSLSACVLQQRYRLAA